MKRCGMSEYEMNELGCNEMNVWSEYEWDKQVALLIQIYANQCTSMCACVYIYVN